MLRSKEILIGLPLGFVVQLYTTFILQKFWGWFITPIFDISSISFLEMYGLTLLINLFSEKNSWGKAFGFDQMLDVIITILDSCVPENKKSQISEFLKEKKESILPEAIIAAVGRLFSLTVSLAIGWCVNRFLSL
jgi:hypothetical protein